MLQFSDITCPTERSKSKVAVFKKVNGKCYFFTQGGCKADGGVGCTLQQAQDQCKTVFGAGILGKVFEPTSVEDNDAVLKAARGIGGWYWIGVSNQPLVKYKSNNKPVSLSTIPWQSGEPSKTASEYPCVWGDSQTLEWVARTCGSQGSIYTICETSF